MFLAIFQHSKQKQFFLFPLIRQSTYFVLNANRNLNMLITNPQICITNHSSIHYFLNILSRLVMIFQMSRKKLIAAAKWSGLPSSYMRTAACVSQAIKAVNTPTETQVETFKSIVAKGFVPAMKSEASPTNCKPTKPPKLPSRTLPQLSKESFLMRQAANEAPPNNAIVRPKHVGKIAGLRALTIPISGAVASPIPNIPIPYNNFLSSEFLDVSLETAILPFKSQVTSVIQGFMCDAPIIPTTAATAPHFEISYIPAIVRGKLKIRQEEHKQPTIDNQLFYKLSSKRVKGLHFLNCLICRKLFVVTDCAGSNA